MAQIKTWIVNLIIMYFLWHFTDVRSESTLQSALLPLMLIVLALFMFVKALAQLGLLNGGGSSGSGGYLGGGDSSGGDGSGCD